MLAIVFSLLASVSWGVADFVGALTSRKVSTLTIVLVGETIGGALLALLLIPDGFHILEYGPWWTATASVVGISGLVTLYWGLANGVMSIIAPIAASGAAIPVLISMAEGTSPRKGALVGAAFAILGVILASVEKEHAATDSVGGTALRSPRFSVGIGLLCALGTGTFLTCFPRAVAQAHGHVLAVVLDVRIISVALLIVMWTVAYLVTRCRASETRKREKITLGIFAAIVTCGVLDTAANSMLAFAADSGNAAIVAVLSSLFPVATVVLAQTFLGERISRLQSVGVATTLAGVFMIAGYMA